MHTSATVAFLVMPSCWSAFLPGRGAGVAAGAPGEAAAAGEGGNAVLVGSSAALEAESSACIRTNAGHHSASVSSHLEWWAAVARLTL